MFLTRITAPDRGLLFFAGKPQRVLPPGVHITLPVVNSVRRITTALVTEQVEIDVITRGGTPTEIMVGYTARVVDVEKSIINVDNPFLTLRASVIAVVSGAANNYTIDQLAQNKNDIAESSEQELQGLSDRYGWGLGDFQVAVGDPSMSEDLKRLLMREEAVRRENAANLDRAKNQQRVAEQLKLVSASLADDPFAQDLLRLQVLTDMGEGSKVIVVDSKAMPSAALASAVGGS
jgi:hypothetical protein